MNKYILVRTIFICITAGSLSAVSIFVAPPEMIAVLRQFSWLDMIMLSVGGLFVLFLAMRRMDESSRNVWSRINHVFYVFPGMMSFGLAATAAFMVLWFVDTNDEEAYAGLMKLHLAWAVLGACGVFLQCIIKE